MFKKLLLVLIVSLLALAGKYIFSGEAAPGSEEFVTYVVDPKSQRLEFFWQDDSGSAFGSISNLKTWLERNDRKLIFATNGGMYKNANLPLGLFIKDYKVLSPLNSANGNGNFYLTPNGVFYTTTTNEAVICQSAELSLKDNVKNATQSGPMLLIDNSIHSSFKQGSSNKNVRNGVGILPDNRVIFVMSKKEVNLYDFAKYFQSMRCKNALYLDGFVSRTYLPEKNWVQTDGNFGVIIGVTEPK